VIENQNETKCFFEMDNSIDLLRLRSILVAEGLDLNALSTIKLSEYFTAAEIERIALEIGVSEDEIDDLATSPVSL